MAAPVPQDDRWNRGFAGLLGRLFGKAVALFAWLVTAPRAIWSGVEPDTAPRIYFANHTSMGDFLLIWTVLPVAVRDRTRPVAGADYWLAGPIRRFIGAHVFHSVLIDRRPDHRPEDPVTQMARVLDAGQSLMIFPEGTRNTTEAPLLPFKTGIYHLSQSRPEIDLIPVWISNLNHVLPKGQVIPVPLVCTVTFGPPLRAGAEEAKEAFLARAAQSLLALAPRAAS